MSKIPFDAAPEGKLLKHSERNKMIGMGVTSVLVVGAFLFSQLQDQSRSGEELNQIAEGGEEPIFEQLIVPEFDASILAGEVLDAREGDRVLLQRKTLDPLLKYTNSFNSAHFLALGVRPLEVDARTALEAEPEAHRAEPYFVRGWIEEYDKRIGSEGKPEFHGRLLLEDRSFAHFVSKAMPVGAIIGDFVRFDGLFLKQFRSEGEDGWVEGPLLVGPKMVHSWAQPEEVDRDAIFSKLAQIRDDTIAGGITGLGGETYDAQWLLMDSILRLGDDGIDWNAAPELNDQTLVGIMTEGAAWRGAPFRLPIARNMDLWTKAPGENPARVEKVTMGWIGSWTWVNNKSAVLHYIMPSDAGHLRGSELVSARGYFIKNFAYETRDGDLRVAPFFVLSHIEEFIPAPDHTGRYIGIALSTITIVTILLIALGLRRDKRRSAEFQADMVRRRRARRDRDENKETS
jgi:hypothetical protein